MLNTRSLASFALVSSIPAAEFQLCLSVGLYAECSEQLGITAMTPREFLNLIRTKP